MKLILLHIIIVLLGALSIVKAEDSIGVKRNSYLTISAHNAYLLPHYVELKEVGGIYNGLDIRYSFQTNGEKFWHWAYKYPQVGFGLNMGKHSHTGIGKLASVYGFGAFPVYDFGKFKLNWDVCAGLGWVESLYDSETNPYNIGISTHLNAYLDFNLNTTFDLSPRTSVFISTGVSHYSNGAGKKPNKGINYISLRTGIRYQLEKDRAEEFKRDDYPKINKKWGLDVRYGRGSLGITNHSELYRIENLGIVAAKRLSSRHRVGFGVDIIKDYSLKWKQYLLDGTHSDKLGYFERKLEGKEISLNQFGVLVSNEFVMRRLSLVTQLGYIIAYSYDQIPFYERFGVRYRILDGLFIDMSLRATGNKARDITWGLGYSLNRGLD